MAITTMDQAIRTIGRLLLDRGYSRGSEGHRVLADLMVHIVILNLQLEDATTKRATTEATIAMKPQTVLADEWH